jgi:hypothetical protein
LWFRRARKSDHTLRRLISRRKRFISAALEKGSTELMLAVRELGGVGIHLPLGRSGELSAYKDKQDRLPGVW